MKPLCDLEERHGVSLGPGYCNDHACATFVKYIGKEQHILLEALSGVRFFGLQADGSTDVGNVEDKLFTCQFLGGLGVCSPRKF